MNLYILENKVPVRVHDFIKFSMFMSNISSRRVNKTSIKGIDVSTVFLGMDHNLNNMIDPTETWKPQNQHIPILFETMIFNAKFDTVSVELSFLYKDTYMKRSCTWEEAETEHRLAVETVEKYIDDREIFEESMKSYNFEIKE